MDSVKNYSLDSKRILIGFIIASCMLIDCWHHGVDEP